MNTATEHRTLPLATRISKEIAEQLKHDGEVDERWMADWIEQEAIMPLLEALEQAVASMDIAEKYTFGCLPVCRAAIGLAKGRE